MPHRNRVDPFGEIHAVASRGALMGNRGVLHDGAGELRRRHAHRRWIACALRFGDRKQAILAPGRYTQLFFLDEATALAAGHRPCAECRRERYRSFVAAWRAVHGRPEAGQAVPDWIDRTLHAARIAPGGTRLTYRAPLASLPDGAMFIDRGTPVLVWDGAYLAWSFDGYRRCAPAAAAKGGSVAVLTPKPLVDIFARGWRPDRHR